MKELSRLAGIQQFYILHFNVLVWLRPLGRARPFATDKTGKISAKNQSKAMIAPNKNQNF